MSLFLAALLALLSAPAAFGQDGFELQDGDRVLLLGNRLIERDLAYGYIEFALTTRWPDRQYTFRNLGWSGDTVFGEARGTYTTPPEPYGHLVNQIREVEPTVVFVAYGGVEAFDGESGVPRFIDGLNQLLDTLDVIGARAVLLSPTPHFAINSPVSDPEAHNGMLRTYGNAIADVAAERGFPFVDLLTPLTEAGQRVALTTNGIHLDELGFLHTALYVERGLGWPAREWAVRVDVAGQSVEGAGTSVSDASFSNGTVTFILRDELLPLPLPAQTDGVPFQYRLTVSGLAEGYYQLIVDGEHVVTATAEAWRKGIPLSSGPAWTQAEELRHHILRKNDFFFNKYRPQNRTYILGFREYEQGQNVTELHALVPLIEEREARIGEVKKPRAHRYRLVPADEGAMAEYE